MPVNVEADINRAIQLTLDAWRNADGSNLSAGQRAAVGTYLRGAGSGPGGQGSLLIGSRLSFRPNRSI